MSRWICRLIPAGVVGYLVLLGLALTGDPRLSDPGLPTLVARPPSTPPPAVTAPWTESMRMTAPSSTTSTTSDRVTR